MGRFEPHCDLALTLEIATQTFQRTLHLLIIVMYQRTQFGYQRSSGSEDKVMEKYSFEDSNPMTLTLLTATRTGHVACPVCKVTPEPPVWRQSHVTGLPVWGQSYVTCLQGHASTANVGTKSRHWSASVGTKLRHVSSRSRQHRQCGDKVTSRVCQCGDKVTSRVCQCGDKVTSRVCTPSTCTP